MESLFSQNNLIGHIIVQMIDACDLLMTWNKSITEAIDYPASTTGMEKMAASCMLIEAIGEGLKKIEKVSPGFLSAQSPETPWKQIMGLRDHIAHGYFNIDAEIIFDVVKNEIPKLKDILYRIKENIKAK